MALMPMSIPTTTRTGEGKATDMAKANIELTRAMTLILIALRKSDGHGYAIMTEIERMTQGMYQVKAGTLYRSLAQLAKHNLIDEFELIGDDVRRRCYRITAQGLLALSTELNRMEMLLKVVDDVKE